jgi:uncharacterized protein YkwD
MWSPTMPGEIAAQAPALDLTELERKIHRTTNSARQRDGLKPLEWSDAIAQVARLHSEDMAQHVYFSHINKQGQNATERAAHLDLDLSHQSGHYMIEGLGENLFAAHRYAEYIVAEQNSGVKTYDVHWKSLDDLAAEAVEAWLNSPSHRANLLSPGYTLQGIGAALGTNGTLFVTQNLN